MSARYTPTDLAAFRAKQVERQAKELELHIALHEALGNLIPIMRLNLKPTNSRRLWAEWQYAKAMHNLYGDEASKGMLDDACAALGVDEEGEELPADPDRDGYGDYLYEQHRDRQLDEQMRREGLA